MSADVKRILKLIESQREACDKRARESKSFQEKSTWLACATTCEVLEAHISGEQQ